MDINWRFGALCATLAFIISFFFGIIGGVGFSTLMARAFLGSAVFAGFGIGVYILVKKFLPDLLQENGGAEFFGEGVDIVIPDHNPHERNGEENEGPAIYDNRRTGNGGDEGESSGEEELDSLVEEIEEYSNNEEAVSRGRSEPLVKAGEVEESAESNAAETSGNVEYVDSLPDVGALSDSFSTPHREEGIDRGDFPGAGNSGEKGDRDPAVLAKVVQTLLKREKEG